MRSGAWWLDVWGDLPRSGAEVDLEVLVLGVSLIDKEAQCLRSTHGGPPSCGAFFVGHPRAFVRGMYLQTRSGWVVERGRQAGQQDRLAVPADLELALKALRLGLYEPHAFGRLPWVPTGEGGADTEVQTAWGETFGRLLGVAPPQPSPPVLSREQQRDELRRQAQQRQTLWPERDQLRAQLEARLQRLR